MEKLNNKFDSHQPLFSLFSPDIIEQFRKWDEDSKEDIERPSWDDLLISQALLWAERSHDAQTKCGCVITNQQYQIIGAGYNGFPRGVNDKLLPNLRTNNAKYDWMIHSEINALINCQSHPHNCVAYVTSKPCFNCLLLMWQFGIREIVYSNHHTAHMITHQSNTQNMNYKIFHALTEGNLIIREIKLDLTHVNRMLENFQKELNTTLSNGV